MESPIPYSTGKKNVKYSLLRGGESGLVLHQESIGFKLVMAQLIDQF